MLVVGTGDTWTVQRELGEVKRFGDDKKREREHFRLWDLKSSGRQIAEGVAFGSCFAAS